MHPHVVVELLDLVKLCWTDGADVSGPLRAGHHPWGASAGTWGCTRGRGPVAGTVQGHVPLQEGLVGELLFADVALVGLLPAVEAHVHVERALLGEALVADAALVRPHSRVRHHVLDKVIFQGEGAPTDAALVGLLTCREGKRQQAEQSETQQGRDNERQRNKTTKNKNKNIKKKPGWFTLDRKDPVLPGLSCPEKPRFRVMPGRARLPPPHARKWLSWKATRDSPPQVCKGHSVDKKEGLRLGGHFRHHH